MKIFVVDDSLTMRRIIINNLKKANYTNTVEATDGEDALKQLNDGLKVDLILLDWNMPKMNGLDFLKTVKADENFKSTPVIMVTTESEKPQVMLALKEGAAGYLVKPISPEAFKKQVIEKIQING